MSIAVTRSEDRSVSVTMYECVWAIENILDKLTKYEDLVSPVVVADSNRWTLRLKQNGDMLSAHLRLEPGSQELVLASYAFKINLDKAKYERVRMMTDFSKRQVGQLLYRPSVAIDLPIAKRCEVFEEFNAVKRTSKMFDELVTHTDLKDKNLCLLDEREKCILTCEIRVITKSFDKTTTSPSINKSRLDFGSMLNDGTGDVTLCAGETSFLAHKVILSARSSVFRAMFENEMKENIEGQVRMDELNPETLNQLLLYIYTGEVPELNKVALELLLAADKYDLADLKDMCEEEAVSQITVRNVTNMLITSNLIGARELKMNSLLFIKTHVKQIVDTSGWIILSRGKYPSLMSDIVKVLGEVDTVFSVPIRKQATNLSTGRVIAASAAHARDNQTGRIS